MAQIIEQKDNQESFNNLQLNFYYPNYLEEYVFPG